jgi:hypothetical protein
VGGPVPLTSASSSMSRICEDKMCETKGVRQMWDRNLLFTRHVLVVHGY